MILVPHKWQWFRCAIVRLHSSLRRKRCLSMRTLLRRRRLESTFISTGGKSVNAMHTYMLELSTYVVMHDIVSASSMYAKPCQLSISVQHQELYLILEAIDNISHMCKNSLKKLNHKSTKPAFAKLKQIEVRERNLILLHNFQLRGWDFPTLSFCSIDGLKSFCSCY